MLIELGGGLNPHPRADIVIDLHHPKNSPAQDATITPWAADSGPWGLMQIESWVADEVFSSHFLEHIPKGQPIIDLMNEAWRVLRPGGTFTAILPIVGYTDPMSGRPMSDHIGWQPWADPTHVSYWWMPDAFRYFCAGGIHPGADYGISQWEQLGPHVDPSVMRVDLLDRTGLADATGAPRSWWTVIDGWETTVRLVKP